MAMRLLTSRLTKAAAAAFITGGMASCAMAGGTGAGGFGAEPDVQPGPLIMTTAGQGGTVLLPYSSAAPRPYALTGGAQKTPEQALRPLGPVYIAGQARILLPPATP